VPVVATASEGARETIDEERTGRLVDVGDTAALARVIEELINDEPERRRLAQNARAVARDRFSLTRMVERTEEVYESAARA